MAGKVRNIFGNSVKELVLLTLSSGHSTKQCHARASLSLCLIFEGRIWTDHVYRVKYVINEGGKYFAQSIYRNLSLSLLSSTYHSLKAMFFPCYNINCRLCRPVLAGVEAGGFSSALYRISSNTAFCFRNVIRSEFIFNIVCM
jgi:hypothetical protein